MVIARKLKKLRGTESLASLARKLGCSYQLLWMYETGQRIPGDNMKEKIAKHYGLPVGYLFYGEKLNKS